MLKTVGIKKVEEENKQFFIEKIIHRIEFESLYKFDPEKKKNRNNGHNRDQ